jgi:hypothetical protein
MAVPVPVPKQSLFKKAVAELKTKGLVETGGATIKLTEKGKAVAEAVIDLLPKMPVAPVAATPASVVVTPEVAAAFLKESAPSTIDVVIPAQLYHMILSKPSTGGGWQSIMAQLQSGLAVGHTSFEPTAATIYVLHLSPWLLAKIVDKATIGSGGYQAVMRWVVCLAAKQHPGAVIAGKGE